MLFKSFPSDFNNLTLYLKTAQPLSMNVLWHPLNFANYLIIPDADGQQGVFIGTSFIRELTGQRDYPGFYSLGPNHDLIKRGMLGGNYELLCRSIWENNINFLVFNKYLDDVNFRSSFEGLFSHNHSFDVYEAQQTRKFFNTLVGDQLASFGNFELYGIKPSLSSESVEFYKSSFKSLYPDDWCSRSNTSRLIGSHHFNDESKTYSFNAYLESTSVLSVVLAEKFGYRYRLVLDGSVVEHVESIYYVQSGGKLISQVTFKQPFTGKFGGEFETRAWLEIHRTVILCIQTLLIFLVGAYLVYRYFTRAQRGG